MYGSKVQFLLRQFAKNSQQLNNIVWGRRVLMAPDVDTKCGRNVLKLIYCPE